MFMIDMHGTLARRYGVKEFAHSGRTVLRLLHREPDQIVILRIDAGRAAGADFARQLARVELDRCLAPADRQADAKAFGIDEVGFGREAHELELWPPNSSLDASSEP